MHNPGTIQAEKRQDSPEVDDSMTVTVRFGALSIPDIEIRVDSGAIIFVDDIDASGEYEITFPVATGDSGRSDADKGWSTHTTVNNLSTHLSSPMDAEALLCACEDKEKFVIDEITSNITSHIMESFSVENVGGYFGGGDTTLGCPPEQSSYEPPYLCVKAHALNHALASGKLYFRLDDSTDVLTLATSPISEEEDDDSREE